MCIEVEKSSKVAFIAELLCIGCAMCVKKCPFKALTIIKLPLGIESEVTHRYGNNQF